MTRCQDAVATLRRLPERSSSPRPWVRSSNPRTEAEAMLSDIAVVLRATRAIKAAMLQRQPCEAAAH